MSRTYRRKKYPPDDWVFMNWEWESVSRYYKEVIDRNTPEGKARLAEYRSDGFATMEQIPKWYKVYYCRKPFREAERRAIDLAVRFPEEDITFPVRKLNANYYW